MRQRERAVCFLQTDESTVNIYTQCMYVTAHCVHCVCSLCVQGVCVCVGKSWAWSLTVHCCFLAFKILKTNLVIDQLQMVFEGLYFNLSAKSNVC